MAVVDTDTTVAADVTHPTITCGVLSVTIYTTDSGVDEEYNNPVFTITPPTSTPNQPNGPKDTWIINLLRITQQFQISGYIDSTSRAVLRTIFKTGNLTDTPCYLSWDNIESGQIPGIMEKLVIHRPATEEQDKWPVSITFTRGSVR